MDDQRLGKSGHADDEAVAADKQRQHHLSDHIVLADDELFQFRDDLLAAMLHPIGQRNVVLLKILFDGRHETSSE